MRKSFTLIELIMVIVIIGILAAISVPRFINLREKAQLATIAGSAGAMRSAISIQAGVINMRDFVQEGVLPTVNEVQNNLINRDSGAYTYQLVMDRIPPNLFDYDGNATNVVNATGANKGDIIGASGGWAYNPLTGQIWANTNVAGENYL